MSDRILPVKLQIRRIVFRAQLRTPYIPQPNQRSIGIRFQNDVVELRRLAESPDRSHAHLVLLAVDRRLLAYLPGRDFHVLLRERTHHIGRGQPASRHAHRIQPQPHRVLALAENNYVRHARNALQRVAHVNVEIVAHEQRRIFVVGNDGRAEDEVLRRFLSRDAHGLHRARQPSLRGVHPVLNIDGRQIRIARQIKCHRDAAGPVVAARRSDILHPLGPVDLLLEGNGDGALHRLRASADI